MPPRSLYTDPNTPAFRHLRRRPWQLPMPRATDGFIFKATGQWTPRDGMLFYATYSEGFRPGLLNRPGGAAGPGGYTVPFALDTR